jgi:ABC-type sugar transport system ATPase subunit
MTLAHRVAVMDGGKVRQLDTPLNIYRHPANKFVAGFLGSPSMNFLEGEIDFGERKFVNHEISLPLESQTLSRLQGQQRVTLGVRPENILISLNQFEGSIAASTYVSEALGMGLSYSELGRENNRRTDAAIGLTLKRRFDLLRRAGAFFRSISESPAIAPLFQS